MSPPGASDRLIERRRRLGTRTLGRVDRQRAADRQRLPHPRPPPRHALWRGRHHRLSPRPDRLRRGQTAQHDRRCRGALTPAQGLAHCPCCRLLAVQASALSATRGRAGRRAGHRARLATAYSECAWIGCRDRIVPSAREGLPPLQPRAGDTPAPPLFFLVSRGALSLLLRLAPHLGLEANGNLRLQLRVIG